MPYREPLPDDCPPDTAAEITSPRTVYRLVRHNPPTDADFRPQRAEHPHLELRNVTECRARGLSVYANRADAERRSKGEQFQGTMVSAVTLAQGAGSIAKTGRRSHHTWWPLADYDIPQNSRVVAL